MKSAADRLERRLTGAPGPGRAVLKGVPRVGPYLGDNLCPQDVPFVACLTACLHYLGEDYGSRSVLVDRITWRLDNLYTYLMGITGAAFRMSWGPGWQANNGSLRYISAYPAEIIHKAFQSVGYDYHFVRKEEKGSDEERFRALIMESISGARRPLLAYGVVGSAVTPDACIITGYDDDGDVVTGWSFHQGEPEFNEGLEYEPSGYFRKRYWFEDTVGVLTIGEKLPKLRESELYRTALSRALDLVRTPRFERYPGRRNGLAAYTAWADALTQHDFPTDSHDDDYELLRKRYIAHNDAAGMVADGRWYAEQFLLHVAEREPAMSGPLRAAAACYQAEHDLIWDMWSLTGGTGRSEAHMRKLAEPVVRGIAAGLILEARDKDAEAAEHIEEALSVTV